MKLLGLLFWSVETRLLKDIRETAGEITVIDILNVGLSVYKVCDL